MNKYLEKIAEMSPENKQTLRTFAQSTAASLPLSFGGAALGTLLANKVKSPILGKWLSNKWSNATIGAMAGSHVLGGAGELVAIKHGFNTHYKNIGKQNEQH